MKKILLGVGALLFGAMSSAQIICYVEAPSPNEGNYDFTIGTGTSWGTPDMTDPANAVSGIMEFVENASPADSLACLPITNDLTGKIAVLYRGDCEFGLKAKNAQNAGAIGVIIINNAGGSPVAMGGSVDGPSVTIPVVMISNTDGALLRPEILAENTVMFIGSKSGLYGDDLGFTNADVFRAKSFANLQLLSQDDTEFEVEVGSWVRNYGSNDQTGITLTCTIDLGATNVYDATSAPFSLLSGDSIFVTLPTFSQSTYANGYYDMEYTVNMTPVDESDYDNSHEADFMISDSLWSYAAIDPVTFKPKTDLAQFNGSTDQMDVCLHFRDANASRITARGINFSAGTSQNPTPTSIEGEFIEFSIFEWTDVFTNFEDPNFTTIQADPTFIELTTVEYVYPADLQNENVYVELDEYITLEDNKRYLFCMHLFTPTIFPGYEAHNDYATNFDTYLQPINVVHLDDGVWFPAGLGTDRSPAMSINFFDAASVNLAELPKADFVAYPNPASESINIPLGNCEGDVLVSIIDITGKVVSTQNVSMTTTMLALDVTSLATGIYTVKVTYADQTSKDVQVVVNR